MAVEVHARPRSRPVAARNDIDARVAFAVARRACRMHIIDGEPAGAQALADEFRAGKIRLSGRVHRRKADQRARQLDEFVAPLVDGLEQSFRGVAGHRGSHGDLNPGAAHRRRRECVLHDSMISLSL